MIDGANFPVMTRAPRGHTGRCAGLKHFQFCCSRARWARSPSITTALDARGYSLLQSALALIIAQAAVAFGGETPTTGPGDPASSVLWYAQPARAWMTEALPLGNGSLGGMFFGLTGTERIQFNHDTLWTGNERDTGAFQAFGDVLVQLGHDHVERYRRELNLDNATLNVSYTAGGTAFRRSAFASHPAGVIVYHFSADKPASYSGRIWLTDMHGAQVVAGADRLTAAGRLGPDGLRYESQLRVLQTGGRVRVETADVPPSALSGVPDLHGRGLPNVSLAFEGCDDLTLVLAAGTDYLADRAKGWRGDDPHADVTRRVDAVSAETLPNLYKSHVADYQSLYRRFQLDLGESSSSVAARPTDERIKAYSRENGHDPDLEELLANYGRYLLISCSRPGDLPANLQGLWNDSNQPAWRCDYHSNINVEMNYWPGEVVNLPNARNRSSTTC